MLYLQFHKPNPSINTLNQYKGQPHLTKVSEKNGVELADKMNPYHIYWLDYVQLTQIM